MRNPDVGVRTRITQADVARAAGVHNATVSLSLRNSRLIPVATRQRIQAIAAQLGYSPDPALRALVAYRHARRGQRPGETLALLTHWDTRWGWRQLPQLERHYLAAQRKAAELGYQFEHFWLGEPGMTHRRLNDILIHRGIRGVVLAAHRGHETLPLALGWSRLSAVKLGAHPSFPAVPQVKDDEGAVVRLALQQVRAAGFHRVGFVVSQAWDEPANGAWSTWIQVEQIRHAADHHVPILHLPDLAPATAPENLAALAHWVRRYRPEVIVGFAPGVREGLRVAGCAIPGSVAFVDLDQTDIAGDIAGVRLGSTRVGELAIETLATQLQQNRFGIPELATVTAVTGHWQAGHSLRARTQPARAPVEALRGRHSLVA